MKDRHLAIPASFVHLLVIMPPVVAVPQRPRTYRGTITALGHIVPLLDLRVSLGICSAQDELRQLARLLDEREQDHRNWLAELEASIRERRAFKLARDPHQCKFGKWYDSYKSDNQTVSFVTLWRSFDAPHKRIHAIADATCELVARGEHDRAQAIIDATRAGDLNELIGLFGAMKTAIFETQREVAVVLRSGERQLAISVDEAQAVESLSRDAIQPLSSTMAGIHTAITPHAILRGESGQIALMLDVDGLFDEHAAAA